ncbi:4-amino-4-deoxychorismate lyase [Humibacillus xanthopallidus]|uniref:4-amino-4-deoxychorismate lyase n=1 Tax=Humibacillus xanthopallidus TaxID=412689 RepID=A0A543PYF4_9MICO|nr:aminodeoxychorismate lyase [Humibacillus xanthopallidus]TQN49080.1 4-amino-4-deoxychorismate lyase [Humibacillus xanthopallidus]
MSPHTSGVPHLVAVLGRGVVGPDEPVVAADDLGLTRGDGCFDSARVVTDPSGTARVVDLDDHLDRLAASARALDIATPPHDAWRSLVAEAVAAWSTPGEAVLKLMLTRGREWRPPAPTALLTITHRGAPSPAAAATDAPAPRTITAVTLTRGHPSDAFADAPWLLGGVKTLSYVVNAAATREAKRRGADDVIFTTTDGFALDGPTAGLLVARGHTLLSTPTGGTGILESLTVAAIMDAARADGFETRFELIPVEQLYTADALWLVSSGRGPVLITALDGRPLRGDPALATAITRYAGF